MAEGTSQVSLLARLRLPIALLCLAGCGHKVSPHATQTATLADTDAETNRPAPRPSFLCANRPAPAPRTPAERLRLEAVERAIGFFSRPPAREPYALIMLDVMHRRFGIAAFETALARYDAELSRATQTAPGLRLFRRIADHENVLQPGDQASVTTALDSLTVPALYCDRTPLPSDYAQRLERANASGGYQRTHALLALLWLRENGCASPAAPGYEQALSAALPELIAADGETHDLELEAAGFLHLYGRGDLVGPAFVDETVRLQHADGGWLRTTSERGGSDWHASIDALFVLLHAYCGPREYPPMLAR